MNNLQVQEKIIQFNSRIQELFEQITQWVTTINYDTSLESVYNNEQLSGEYETFQLVILNSSKKVVAKIKPVGIWIIGGEGRIDLIGSSSSEMIVYLSEGGPSMTSTISIGDRVQEEHRKTLYGYKEEGWHWIDYRVMGRQPKLDQTILLHLLEGAN